MRGRERLRGRKLAWIACLAMMGGGAAPAGGAARVAREAAAQARQILDAAGVRGGLVVHLGCGEGRLTAALRATERFVVHGLDPDAAKVAKARAHIHQLGLAGAVCVERWTARRLPHADQLVDLVVAEDLRGVPMAEARRVLAPGGVLAVRRDGAWTGTRKPWPADLDAWSHFLHDASNNAVARDRRVGPPRRVQWWAGPRWSRSHEFISSLAAMVSAGGRVFYVFDEGLTGVTDRRLPERWALMARDAFNGVLLWRRPLPDWRGRAWRSTALRGRPASVARRLVAHGERLYATLSSSDPVVVLDAATGEALRTLEGTEGSQEIALLGQSLLVWVHGADERRGQPDGAILTLDAESGQVRWQAAAPRVVPLSLVALGDRVVYCTGKETVCLSLADGGERWRAKRERRRLQTLLLHGDLVLETDGSHLTARDAASGQVRWTARTGGRSMRGQDLFVAHGMAWHAAGAAIAGYDLATGQVARTVDPSSVQSPGHHLRCYRAKATERFLITQWRGAEFVSLTGEAHAQSDWVRGPCRYGVVPCNGLLYVPPNPCFCYPGAKVTGFLALSTEEPELPEAAGQAPLERGPAYAQAAGLASAPASHEAADWPTYRHDARRTGATASEVPARLTVRWQARLAGELTPPVLSRGRLYAAVKGEHTLYAFRAEDGTALWHVTAGGRIDSPPTLMGELVLFGSADGWVYALRASDGALAWRVRAAPADRRIVAFGRVESPWPVHGSVLEKDGRVYCTAGRSTFLDGGIWLRALDPKTGGLVHEARVDTWARTRTDAEGKPFIPAYYIEGANSDILVSQGPFLYLGQYKFDRALAPQPVPYVMPEAEEKTTAMDLAGRPFVAEDREPNRDYETHQRRWLERTQKDFLARLRESYGGISLGDRRIGLHVFSTAGFLDDSWYNRTVWMYSATWPGYYIAHRAAKTGQLLVVGPQRTYAVQAYPSRNLQSPLFTPGERGYLLFADRNDNEPVLDHRTRGTTKGWGFTRREPPVWHAWVPIRIRAMVLAGPHLFVAGPPDVVDPEDPMASFEGRKGGVLRALAAEDGTPLAERALDAPPVFDGLIAAGGRLYMATTAGRLVCLEGRREP